MATLRAAALLLNGALIVVMLALMAREFPREAHHLLLGALFLAVPIVNAVTIILQARRTR